MSTRNLDALFAPASVAIIGASDRPGSVGRQVVLNVRESFKGPIYAVNPRRLVLEGVSVFPTIAALPEAPDLALIVTPADGMVEAAEALAARGTRGALIISDARRGTERAGNVRIALRQIADRTGMRIAGPNALGFMSPELRATMSRLHAPPGTIAFVGQATMAAGAVAEWTAQQHLGLSGVAAAGDMIDVDFGDLIDWFAADTRTRLIVAVMDRVGDATKFLSAVRLASRIKPLIVLRAAIGPLQPRHEAVFDAALRRTGALCARTLEDLFAAMQAIGTRLPSDAPPTVGRRVAIFSNGASLAALGRMALDGDDVELATLEDATVETLGALLPAGTGRSNPLDILPDAPPGRFSAVLDTLMDDRHVDAVLGVFGPSGTHPATEIADALSASVDSARRRPGRRRPFIMTAFAGGANEAAARDRMNARHIPTFDTPSTALRAFTALVRLKRASERVTATPEFVASLDPALTMEVRERAEADLKSGADGLSGSLLSAIRKALWIGRSGENADMLWRIEVAIDPEFGPAIFFGLGGAPGRIASRHTAALPPLNAATAQELINASYYARAALSEGLLDDSGVYALAALLVRVSDLLAAVPVIRALTIDRLSAQDGRPNAPAEALSGSLMQVTGDPDRRFAIRPYPAHLARPVQGADGTSYRLRPMRAEDEPGLIELGNHMSREDLRLRFFQPMRNLSHDLAVRLTNIDYAREMAFALLPTQGEMLLGVVRLHRETRGESGEFAVTVRSDQKGKGLGRLLMHAIIDYARAQGLQSIFGIVLAENRPMLRLAHALGFTSSIDLQDATVVRVELRLSTTP